MPKRLVGLVLLAAALWACDDDGAAAGGDAGGDSTQGDVGVPDAAEEVSAVEGCETDIVTLPIGEVALGADGLSDTIAFDVPECASAFMLTVAGPDDVYFILDELRAPDGSVWITDEPEEPIDPLTEIFLGAFPGQYLSPVRMVQGEGVATALVVNSSAVTFQPGTYEAVVLGGHLQSSGMTGVDVVPWEGTVDVEVLWKTVDTEVEGGVLDVNLYLSAAGGFTAATAPDSEYMQAAIVRLGEIYGQAGIELGEIRYFDIAESFRTIESIEGPNNELSRMFALSDGGPGGMNYFMVDRFEVQGLPGGAIGGIAGGIPGPALRPGTARSGVAVSLAAGEDPAITAHIMAHEGGHYLGLFHTQEFFGAKDPIDDTPEENSDMNLMYPAVGGGAEITAGQARVMHNHVEVAP